MSWKKYKTLRSLRIGRFNVEQRRTTFTNYSPNETFYEVLGQGIGLRFHQKHPPTQQQITEALGGASRSK